MEPVDFIVETIPTSDLLKVANPDNPRDHFEEDIKATAFSLLEVGWAEYGVVKQKDGYLLGGHGRVLAANWLSQQTSDWFEYRWSIWLRSSRKEKPDVDLHLKRFHSEYWQYCPVIIVDLDEPTQKATMIRLNNQRMDGQDNPEKLREILSRLKKEELNQAGWTSREAKEFIQGLDRFDSEDSDEDENDDDFEEMGFDDDENEEEEGGNYGTEEIQENRESRFPLSIVLNWQQYKAWKSWKQQNKIGGDGKALIAAHPAFEIEE